MPVTLYPSTARPVRAEKDHPMSLFNKIVVCAVVLVSLSAVAVAQAQRETETPAEDTRYTLKVGLSGYSPVSYLDHNRAEPGSPRYTAEHEGVTYFFTSRAQIETFRDAPERYMPAYGGYCAFGCSVESHFVPDPTSFKIIDGRVHLFLKNSDVDAFSLWEDGDEAELKEKADAYWADQGREAE